MTLERRHQYRSSVFILNLEQFSRHILVLQSLTLHSLLLAGTDDIANKTSQNIFFPFNFAITKICAAIHLTEDETRTGGI